MRHDTPTDYRQHTRPSPPSRRSTWGVSDATARAFGYPPSRPPSLAERVEYLEQLTEWLADRLEERDLERAA